MKNKSKNVNQNNLLFYIKKELFCLLKQPLFFVVIIAFSVFTGFFHFIVNNFFSLDSGSTDLRQFFLSMPYISIIIIPILTTNIWYAQSDLFKSFPISAIQNVLSKVICLIIAYFVMLLFTIPTVICTSFFGAISVAQVFTGYFGILFYSFAIISFCVYIFLVFENKAISFFISVAIIALINTIHFVPLLLTVPTWISSFVRVFSASWHFDSASKGILDTRDVLFYLIIFALFIVLSVLHQSNIKKGKIIFSTFFYPIIALLLILNSNLYYARFDLTKEKQFSLSAETKQTIKNVNQPLQITYYLSKELESLYPQVQDIKEFLYQLSYSNSNIQVKIIDPQSKKNSVSTTMLNNLGITSQQIQAMEENKTSVVSVYSSILLEYQGMNSVLPFTIASSTLEYELLTRLKALVSGFSMEALVLVGNGLSLTSEYMYIKPWLEASGFFVKEVTAYELETITVTPRQCLVVLGSSKLTLNDTVSIETYLQNGGKALFAISANTVDITSSWQASKIPFDPVIDMLQTFGFTIGSEIVEDLSNYRLRMYAVNDVSVDYNNSVYVNYPFWIVTMPQNVNSEHPITKNFTGLELYWPSPLKIEKKCDGEYYSLVKSSELSWLQAPYSISKEVAFLTEPFGSANQKPSNIEYDQYSLAGAFSGTLLPYFLDKSIENTKIVVVSDQYFASSMIENTNSAHNLNFLIDSCLYLSDCESLIPIKNKNSQNTSLYKITDAKAFAKQKQSTLIMIFAIIPTIILILAFVCFMARKNINNHQKEIILKKSR